MFFGSSKKISHGCATVFPAVTFFLLSLAEPALGDTMKSKSLKVAATMLGLFLISSPALAQEAAHAASSGTGWGVFGAMLGMGIAAAVCGMGQGRAAAAALEGIARNPQAAGKIQTPMLIALVFIETLVLFTFGFGFLALGNL